MVSSLYKLGQDLYEQLAEEFKQVDITFRRTTYTEDLDYNDIGESDDPLSVDPLDPREETTTDYTFPAFLRGMNAKEAKEANVEFGTKMVKFPAKNITFEPNTDDLVIIQGKQYGITGIRGLPGVEYQASDSALVGYELMVSTLE